jgi:hypothetical protein
VGPTVIGVIWLESVQVAVLERSSGTKVERNFLILRGKIAYGTKVALLGIVG